MPVTPAPEFRVTDQPAVAFDACDSGQAVLANRAVMQILAESGLTAQHHGPAGPEEAGRHLWTVEGVDAETLRGLLTQIAERFDAESFG